MSEASSATSQRSHLSVTMHLLWLLAVVLQLSRLLNTQSTTGETPFHSANDRSRWCTVAALAIHGSYVIDEMLEIRDPRTKRRTWYTIDLVQHRGRDGQQHFYSSKPPLLATLVTGVYLLVRAATGATVMNDTFFAARSVLVLVNLLPLAFGWWLGMRWLRNRAGLDDWSKLVLFTFLLFGTFLSTFANTLNNHLPAALAIALSLLAVDRALFRRDHAWRWFWLAGLASSFAAANELPALSWVAAVGLLLAMCNLRKCLLGYVPALLPVALGFFGTNYLAHDQFAPAYAHRSLGARILSIPFPKHDVAAIEIITKTREELRRLEMNVSPAAVVRAARRPGISELWDPVSEHRFGLQFVPEGQAWKLNVHHWGDWYDYPGSYWTEDRKQGVDRGEPDRSIYIFHSLLGHHGIFSLTPFWFMSLFGAVWIWGNRSGLTLHSDARLWLTAAILGTSCVAIAFYLTRPLEDRNYGGVTSGFRWAFWLAPLWLWLAAYGMRVPQSTTSRRVVEGLLAVSIFSATYAWANPWSSPWLMQYWQYLGWID